MTNTFFLYINLDFVVNIMESIQETICLRMEKGKYRE